MIAIDVEKYSPVDIAKTGVYRYALDPDFKILLFGYSVDGAPVKVVDLALGESIPSEVIDALLDDRAVKRSFNAMFERVTLSSCTVSAAWSEGSIFLHAAGTVIWFGQGI